jgi:hypothetical protein
MKPVLTSLSSFLSLHNIEAFLPVFLRILCVFAVKAVALAPTRKDGQAGEDGKNLQKSSSSCFHPLR